MAYKLIKAAQACWREVDAPELVALIRAGAAFHKGRLVGRLTEITGPREQGNQQEPRRSRESTRPTNEQRRQG